MYQCAVVYHCNCTVDLSVLWLRDLVQVPALVHVPDGPALAQEDVNLPQIKTAVAQILRSLTTRQRQKCLGVGALEFPRIHVGQLQIVYSNARHAK